MISLRLLLTMLAAFTGLHADSPVYSAASIVNSADGQTSGLAPNTIGTLYGTGLAFGTKALTADDIRGGVLPTVLPGTGVRVLIGGLPANLYYVSPTQINFLVPPILLPGKSDLQLAIDGIAGPLVQIQLATSNPALFQADPQTPIATRLDASLITAVAPAKPGSIVTLYATGLGQTTPPVFYGELPTHAAPLKQIADFKVVLDGIALNSGAVAYAGIAPGFAGLYQINLTLPQSIGPDPEIRIGFGDTLSRAGLRLPVRP
jgi:uncharacterized protein (TIGR03437 family)